MDLDLHRLDLLHQVKSVEGVRNYASSIGYEEDFYATGLK